MTSLRQPGSSEIASSPSAPVPLFQRLRDRHAGLSRYRPVQLSRVQWSEEREEGERSLSRAGVAADEENKQQYPPRYRLSSLVPDIVTPYVFLGFSHSGTFVWSYRQGDTDRGEDSEWDYFQVWVWRQGQPLVLLVNEPFYYCQEDDDDEFGGESEHPLVSVVESDDDSCVVVYAYKRPTRGDEWRKYHFCVLPIPTLPLPASTPSTTVALHARVGVAAYRFTCDCQEDEAPPMPVSLKRIAQHESSVASAGCHLLLVQTSTAVHCLRFDVEEGSVATWSTLSNTQPVDDVTDSHTANGGASSMVHFRRDRRVLGSHSWMSEQHSVPADDSTVQSRVVVRAESSLDVERLIAEVDELGSEFRLRDYYFLDCKLGMEALQDSSCPVVYVLALQSDAEDGGICLQFVIFCVDFANFRFSWRLLDWSAEQLASLQVPAAFHAITHQQMFLRITQLPSPLSSDGQPRYCLGCTGEERAHRNLWRCRAAHSSLLGHVVRTMLRLPKQALEKVDNAAVLAGQSKVELWHPAGTAVITL